MTDAKRPSGRRTLAVLEAEHTALYSKYTTLMDEHAQLISKHNDLLVEYRALNEEHEALKREFSPRRFLRQFMGWLGQYSLGA